MILDYVVEGDGVDNLYTLPVSSAIAPTGTSIS